MKTQIITYTLLIMFSFVSANPTCAGIFGKDESPAEQRKQIQTERKEVLDKVFKLQPQLEKKVEKAPGYATFSAVNMNLLLLATTRGTGIVVDNEKNEVTYMKVTSVGGGIGAGVKDLSVLIIFNEHEALERFVNSGWYFAAQADAALKVGEKGGEVGESTSVAAPTKNGGLDASMSGGMSGVTQVETAMEIYKITETGIAAQATVSGVKFSKDDELN